MIEEIEIIEVRRVKTTFWMKSIDDTEIYVEKWVEEDQEPKAIVQIAHGMAEHFQRYHDFIQFLVQNGIYVYGNDHRGHGKTGQKQGLMGYFSDKDGFEKATNDLHQITQLIKTDYPNTPLFLLGHSMGSFLSRHYIQKFASDISGVILSGTGYYPRATSNFGKLVASRLAPKEKSPFMNKLAFGTFNRKIKNPKTPFDWLTRDETVVQAYLEDSLSGYIPTARFFVDLMTGLLWIHSPERNKQVPKDLPMFIISGDEDPVGSYGKGVWKTASMYKNLGIEDISVSLVEGARHEVLNEINKEEVYTEIVNWVLKHLAA
jgi:alpha-beta hydrolase superfamily lysophospholipase